MSFDRCDESETSWSGFMISPLLLQQKTFIWALYELLFFKYKSFPLQPPFFQAHCFFPVPRHVVGPEMSNANAAIWNLTAVFFSTSFYSAFLFATSEPRTLKRQPGEATLWCHSCPSPPPPRCCHLPPDITCSTKAHCLLHNKVFIFSAPASFRCSEIRKPRIFV